MRVAGVVARQGAAIGAAFALVAAFAAASPGAPAVAREVAAGTGLGVLVGLSLLLLVSSAIDAGRLALSTKRIGATMVALFSALVTLRRWHARAEGTTGEPSVAGALLTVLLLLLLWRALVHAADRDPAAPTAAEWFPLGVLGALLAHRGLALDPRWGAGWPLRSLLQNLVLVAAAAAAAAAIVVLTARGRSATRHFPRVVRYTRVASWLAVGAGVVGLLASRPDPQGSSHQETSEPAAKRDDGFFRSPGLGSQVLVKLGTEVRAAVSAPCPSDLSYPLDGARSVDLAWGTGSPVRETTAHFRAVLKAADGRSQILLEDTVISTAESRPQWLTRTVLVPAGMNTAELLLQTRGTSRKAFWAAPVFSRRPTSGTAGRNVVIVSLDTVGANHVGAYGYSRRPTTPELDAWAREGTLFENAWSTAPGTLSSQMSVLTGRYPSAQGVSYARWRLTGSVPSLPPEVSTLPQILAPRGILTAAFTGSGYFGLPVGYSRGFLEYVSTDDKSHGSAVNVFEKAFDWLERRRDQPFFLFLHTYEAHEPYLDERFLSRDGPRAHDGKTRNEALYDGDIRRADTYVGALRRTLDRLGLTDRTFVIVLADHGEEFGGHFDVWNDGHGHSLYEEITHVPLVIVGPAVRRGRRVKRPVDLTAIAPTVLELLGIEPPAEMEGRRLAAALRGEPLAGERDWRAISEDVWIGPARRAIRTEAFKLIEKGEDLPERFVVNDQRRAIQRKVLDLPARMLFHLPTDPGELKNLLTERATEAVWLHQLLSARLPATPRAGPESGEIPIEGDARERLRALGYLN